jgi:Protein of unknown function (DUF3037)
MNEIPFRPSESSNFPNEYTYIYRVLRYTPNPVRDEWINIGILIFNPHTGERRLRMLEEEEEYRRVRRFHPQADVALLRALRDDLEDRFQTYRSLDINSNPHLDWQQLLAKWDDTLSNAEQMTRSKGLLSLSDIDTELDRLYDDHVGVQYVPRGLGASGNRASVRKYCSQVLRQARLWDRMKKSVSVEQWTMPGDPMRIDYNYRRNGTLGFVQTLSMSRTPGDFRQLAYVADRIKKHESLNTEFAVVTDVPLVPGKKRDDFVAAMLKEFYIEPVAMEGFAVWVAKLKPLFLQ